MTDEKFNEIWELVEPIVFENRSRNVMFMVSKGELSPQEAMKIYEIHNILKEVVVNSYGLTVEELENETEIRINKQREEYRRMRETND